jgi:hypothetical protein
LGTLHYIGERQGGRMMLVLCVRDRKEVSRKTSGLIVYIWPVQGTCPIGRPVFWPLRFKLAAVLRPVLCPRWQGSTVKWTAIGWKRDWFNGWKTVVKKLDSRRHPIFLMTHTNRGILDASCSPFYHAGVCRSRRKNGYSHSFSLPPIMSGSPFCTQCVIWLSW